jgi:hypothetical protein
MRCCPVYGAETRGIDAGGVSELRDHGGCGNEAMTPERGEIAYRCAVAFGVTMNVSPWSRRRMISPLSLPGSRWAIY